MCIIGALGGEGTLLQKALGVKAELGPGAENPLICWWGASRLLLGEVGGNYLGFVRHHSPNQNTNRKENEEVTRTGGS